MPSPGFEPRPYGFVVSVTNHQGRSYYRINDTGPPNFGGPKTYCVAVRSRRDGRSPSHGNRMTGIIRRQIRLTVGASIKKRLLIFERTTVTAIPSRDLRHKQFRSCKTVVSLDEHFTTILEKMYEGEQNAQMGQCILQKETVHSSLMPGGKTDAE
ncbi:hypothetical protein TNCV_3560831 [Trichonephila clavipes]|nr:hypothetical protein TNCV_3560831 [Trichonephila clavipes]